MALKKIFFGWHKKKNKRTVILNPLVFMSDDLRNNVHWRNKLLCGSWSWPQCTYFWSAMSHVLYHCARKRCSAQNTKRMCISSHKQKANTYFKLLLNLWKLIIFFFKTLVNLGYLLTGNSWFWIYFPVVNRKISLCFSFSILISLIFSMFWIYRVLT